MDIIRKISDQGQVYLNEDQLNWIGTKQGDWVIVKDDDGKKGPFLSLFKPTQPQHKKLVQQEEEKKNGAPCILDSRILKEN